MKIPFVRIAVALVIFLVTTFIVGVLAIWLFPDQVDKYFG